MIKLDKYLKYRIKKFNEIMKKYPSDIIKGKWPNPIYLLDRNGNYIMNGIGISKVEKDGVNYKKLETFNLSDPIERQLSRISGFYEVLMKLDVGVDKETVIKLEEEIKRDASNAINWEADAWQDMGEFAIMYDYEGWCNGVNYCKNGCIIATYSEYQYGEHIQGLEKGDEYDRYECYSKEEFNLLMQIYYGIYDDEKLKKELEKKEKRGEYEKMKDIVRNNTKWGIYDSIGKLTKKEKQLLEEYLKLELMRKSTDGSFEIKNKDDLNNIYGYDEKIKEINNKVEEFKMRYRDIEEVIKNNNLIDIISSYIVYNLIIDEVEYNNPFIDGYFVINYLNEGEVDKEKLGRYLKNIGGFKKKFLEIYMNNKIKKLMTTISNKIDNLELNRERIKREKEDKIKNIEKYRFKKLKIKKIYDKNWNEEEQKKVVEKINKELGKEVVVLEE